ncbi:class I SAM-dependent methyltransferase [Streptomyces solaniscabiei]
MRRHLGAGRGRPALDIGCGEGELTAHLDRLGHRATGIDCSPTAVAAARERRPGLDLRVMDFDGVEPDRLPHSAFAVVTCRLVHRWAADKPAFLSRVRRLLAPGVSSGWSPPCTPPGRSRPGPGTPARPTWNFSPPGGRGYVSASSSRPSAATPCGPDTLPREGDARDVGPRPRTVLDRLRSAAVGPRVVASRARPDRLGILARCGSGSGGPR